LACQNHEMQSFNKSVGADLAGGNGGWFASLYSPFFLRPNSSTLNVLQKR
jgi:hypothetical protein